MLFAAAVRLAQLRLGGLPFADSPTPTPSIAPQIDPDRVSPGALGLASFIFLVVAVFLLWFSMNRHLRRVDFEVSEDKPARAGAPPEGPTSASPEQ